MKLLPAPFFPRSKFDVMAFCLEKNLSVIQVGDNTPGDPKKIATCGLHVTRAVCQAVQPDKCCTNTARHKLTETATPRPACSYSPAARTTPPRSLLLCCFLKGLAGLHQTVQIAPAPRVEQALALNCSSH